MSDEMSYVEFQEHITALRNAGYYLKVWSVDDFTSQFEGADEFEDMSGEEIEEISAQAFAQARQLEDCTDQDWDIVLHCLNTVLYSRGDTRRV